jgi:hypothetical protein
MKLFRRHLTRAQAIERAIDTSDPGDQVSIHQSFCTDSTVCCCTPLEVYVGGEGSRNPMGFRMREGA